MSDLSPFADGLFMPESPRWHAGRLWLTDIRGRTVLTFDEAGVRVPYAVFEDDPSGLGFDAQGRLHAVLMSRRCVVRVTEQGMVEVADLSGFEPAMLNDMAMAPDGTAFVTRFGYNPWAGERFATATVLRVRPGGAVEPVGPELAAPNGVALAPDGSRLYVAESAGGRIWVLDEPLSADRPEASVLAELAPAASSSVRIATPDGICLDADGGVWAADPTGHRVLRLDATGAVTETIEFDEPDQPLAVALGGADRLTLFIAVSTDPSLSAPRVNPRGRVVSTRVAVPGC